MNFILKQNVFNTDDSYIGYVEVALNAHGETYRLNVNERDKKDFNSFARHNGFKVGKITEDEYNAIVNAETPFTITI